MTTSVLIGYTGFVGGYLAQAAQPFDLQINRANLDLLRGQSFEKIVCAGLPAAKWLANREPAADLANMQRLCDVLTTVKAHQFILISTVDVYPALPAGNSQDVTAPSIQDESFDCSSWPNHPYGAHRLQFETFVKQQFEAAHIIRLPALFGPGLKKNVLFDLLHDNCLEMINPQCRFQWYPLTRLNADIETVIAQQLPLVNFVTEPLATLEILQRFFPDKAVGQNAGAKIEYDILTRYGELFGGNEHYLMRKGQVLDALADWLSCG